MPNYRKSDASKRVAGTFRQDRAKRRPPGGGLKAVPQPPDRLSAASKAEWRRLAPQVTATRVLATTDLRSLELLADVLATASAAQATLAEQGLTIGTDGGVRAHPAVKILEGARAQAIRLLIEFGLTPRARSHVEPASDAIPNNPFEALTHAEA